MIFARESDHESYIRAKSIDEMKQNQYLVKDNLVKLPNDINYFLITDEVTEIILENGLYAKKIMISDEGLQTNDKTIVGAINELKNIFPSVDDDGLLHPSVDENSILIYEEYNSDVDENGILFSNNDTLPNIINGVLTHSDSLVSNGNFIYIKNISVSIDDGLGEPYAIANVVGNTLNFEFKNLKGNPGQSAFNEKGQIVFPNGSMILGVL